MCIFAVKCNDIHAMAIVEKIKNGKYPGEYIIIP